MIDLKILRDREEWLKHRATGIGGSEIAAVIGKNPWMSNVDLWRKKVSGDASEDEDISSKPAVIYGNEMEDLLRQAFCIDYKDLYEVKYGAFNSFHNDRYPWANASLDGWLLEHSTGRTGILEIKTTEINSSAQMMEWKDKIPDHYYCQVLFYMAVCEADFAVLKAQIKRHDADGNMYLITRHYRIERADCEDDIRLIMEAGERFWNENVLKKVEPPLVLSI